MLLAYLVPFALLAGGTTVDAGSFFKIIVVDEQSGRGVPLVELRTTNNIRYYTDSAGVVAFLEPGLMDQKVFFSVKSHGYEFPADGFGIRGRALDVTPGGNATLKIKRINIAERLYRVIGQGIYRDSVLLGLPTPIAQPVINGQVMGSDSVLNIVYRGKIHWFWGDTGRPAYPLGLFQTPGATSLLPADGGLEPEVGVNLTYFVDETGFAKKMTPMPGSNPVWIDSLVVLPDESGRERMYAAYSRIKGATMQAYERGLIRYDDDKQEFEKITTFDLNSPILPSAHPLRHVDHGIEYFYFPAPFPHTRVRANLQSYTNLASYEAYTCLKEGSRFDSPQFDRDADGRIRYAWRKNTPPLGSKEQDDLIKAGTLKNEETLVQLQDPDTGQPITPHSGSVYWNAYRQRWITIRSEIKGTSVLGEIWYAEADSPIGPWVYARKIVTHDQYSFYNPKQHPMFDREGGRIIYFEGTYTNSFSGNPDQTPRYDYNQIMYKLNLDDPRLVLPVPVYDQSRQGKGPFGTHSSLPPSEQPIPVPFFACDRPRDGLIPIYTAQAIGGLQIGPLSKLTDPPEQVVFYALPAEMANPPATSVALYEFSSVRDRGRLYRVDADGTDANWTRAAKPLCRVWRNPTTTVR